MQKPHFIWSGKFDDKTNNKDQYLFDIKFNAICKACKKTMAQHYGLNCNPE